ncbi:hypothetical protein ASPWEDRAFT_471532 [Aspergillus wentii DTO 134E9]|uniref:Acyltransferase 3 domain-containing protein n=1 Tax=Aspergillus wentii DTO 134E9 TaxID=1073089 RepID=A0A1L9RSV7_ASPWE|nr:uncharacterized protein ASPWEDRAFT_471532 [Aspergillus wentii DTO 134E9]KAI9930727.1 hypothetical protein MW887_011484 [Aspergillus wentii]OJJ37897.1 hypothetical protein ASPWEDRAFT_471532 [Aspergillus wentii DTO 134E9]
MERKKWLDGLRGVAAAIVAFDHFFMTDVWHPFLSFWNERSGMNGRLVQLPPIRVLFSAHAMVTLFMVISGYAISINILNSRSNRSQFWTRLSSAIWRRGFRIYLPVLVISAITQVLFFFGFFHWTFDENLLMGIEPWSHPWAHVKWLFTYMMDNMNIVTFQYRGGLNPQLWTMPIEFRGSYVVFLLIAGSASWRPKLRLWVLPVLAVYFFWYGTWDVFGFIWGLWLAERTVAKEDEEEEKVSLQIPVPRSCNKLLRLVHLPQRKLPMSKIITVFCFLAGFHLICLGNDGELTPGYQFLAAFQPSAWKDNWELIHWSWKAVGAAMLVHAINESPLLQRPFDTRFAQYLGHISFSVYLLHEGIYELWRDPVRNFFWMLLNGSPYPGGPEAAANDPFSFHLTWWMSGIMLGSVVVGLAHYYTIHVDQRCVAFTKKLEKLLTR